MGKVLSFANQKGGVGKTTMAFNFAALLGSEGYKTLLIDLDSQANLTSYFGIKDAGGLQYTTGHAVQNVIANGSLDMQQVKILTNREIQNLCLLGANNHLYQIKQMLMEAEEREFVLKKITEPLSSVFDYIIIDCAPSLDIDLVNALVASDEVLIVSTPSPFSYSGSEELMRTIARIKKNLNPNIRIAGVICNKVNRRNNFTPEMLDVMRNAWEDVAPVFESEIPSSVRVEESQCESRALVVYEKSNPVTQTCINLLNEYHKKVEGKEVGNGEV